MEYSLNEGLYLEKQKLFDSFVFTGEMVWNSPGKKTLILISGTQKAIVIKWRLKCFLFAFIVQWESVCPNTTQYVHTQRLQDHSAVIASPNLPRHQNEVGGLSNWFGRQNRCLETKVDYNLICRLNCLLVWGRVVQKCGRRGIADTITARVRGFST